MLAASVQDRDGAKTSVLSAYLTSLIPRRGCVERTLAWFTACRRLARDCERDPATSEAMIRWRLSHALRGTPGLAKGH